jgi:protein HOOK3
MTQYFADILQKPTSGLDVPDLQAIAKDHSVPATLTMCRLTIAIGVQCEKNKQFIDRIQGLSETDQHYLMKAIEQARFIWLWQYVGQLIHTTGHGTNQSLRWSGRRGKHDRARVLALKSTFFSCVEFFRDDHYYQIQSERSQILSEKETLEKVYQSLLDEHRTLQTSYDDVVSEKDDAVARLRDARREVDSPRRSDKSDGAMRGEIDRLRTEL